MNDIRDTKAKQIEDSFKLVVTTTIKHSLYEMIYEDKIKSLKVLDCRPFFLCKDDSLLHSYGPDLGHGYMTDKRLYGEPYVFEKMTFKMNYSLSRYIVCEITNKQRNTDVVKVFDKDDMGSIGLSSTVTSVLLTFNKQTKNNEMIITKSDLLSI